MEYHEDDLPRNPLADLSEIRRYSELPHGEQEEQARSRIQREIGEKSFPHLITLVKERSLSPDRALLIAEGVETNDRSFYNFVKGLAMLRQTYANPYHDGIEKSLEDMAGFAYDRDEFVRDSDRILEMALEKANYGEHLAIARKVNAIRARFLYIRQERKRAVQDQRNGARKNFNLSRSPFQTRPVLDEFDAFDAFPSISGIPSPDQVLNDLKKSRARKDLMKRITVSMIESDPNVEEYYVFTDEGERKEAVEIGKRIAMYMHDRGLNDIIFMDRAARPAYVSLVENWHHLYPDEKVPNIYFMNPKGFKDYYSLLKKPMSVMADMLKSELSGLPVDDPSGARRPDEIRQDLKKTYSQLFSERGKHVVLFDNCVHGGETMGPVIEQLEGLGLDVRVGLSGEYENKSHIRPDFVCVSGEPKGSCYPFDEDAMVEKSYRSVKSRKTTKKDSIVYSARIRQELRKAVKEYYQ